MQLPVHLLRQDAAHINVPGAKLQLHSKPRNAKHPPLCSVTVSWILLTPADHQTLLTGAFWDSVIELISEKAAASSTVFLLL